MDVCVGIAIALIAFCAEYTDSTLGMGYGTLLTPVLLLFGYSPLQVVPAILLSELITGLLSAAGHHRAGNVNLKMLGGASKHSKVAIVLGLFSIIGVVVAVALALNLPKFWLKLYIGMLVTLLGIAILVKRNKTYPFSWLKICVLGAVASMNKGMSGGGYGPLVVSGQMLSGVETKAAIGVTSLAEGLTCAVGLAAYWIVGTGIDWTLAPWLVCGAVVSIIPSVWTVRRLPARSMTVVVGIVTLILGMVTLVRLVS